MIRTGSAKQLLNDEETSILHPSLHALKQGVDACNGAPGNGIQLCPSVNSPVMLREPPLPKKPLLHVHAVMAAADDDDDGDDEETAAAGAVEETAGIPVAESPLPLLLSATLPPIELELELESAPVAVAVAVAVAAVLPAAEELEEEGETEAEEEEELSGSVPLVLATVVVEKEDDTVLASIVGRIERLA